MCQNFIIINAPMGARGHQLGRLISSSTDVLWYDYFKNGTNPWNPSLGIGKTVSVFHYDRRFKNSFGTGIDNFSVPPVLERATNIGEEPYPYALLNDWSKKIYPKHITFVVHDTLQNSKKLFPNAKHIIVIPPDLDFLLERLEDVGADYVYQKNPKKTLKESWKEPNKTFKESARVRIQETINSYQYANENDIVINNLTDLLEENNFIELCNQLGIRFNEERFLKTKQFLKHNAPVPVYEVKELRPKHKSEIENFCLLCADKGFKNNIDLKTIKFDWCIEQGGTWFGTYKNKNLISMSGMHPFKDGFRVLFRGAQLESRPVRGLNKYQFQSWGMYAELPMQIEWARRLHIDNVYITTNIENDASGRMNRIHKAFSVLASAGVVDYKGDEEIFFTKQSVWKLNIEKYFEIRKVYES